MILRTIRRVVEEFYLNAPVFGQIHAPFSETILNPKFAVNFPSIEFQFLRKELIPVVIVAIFGD